MTEIVATTSLPVDRLSATDCNAAARANFQRLFMSWFDLFAVVVAVSKVFLLLTKIVIDIVNNCPKLLRARYSWIVV